MTTPSRIAVVGCGEVSAMHFAGMAAHRERVTVVAAVDPVPARRDWARTTWGVPNAYASVVDMLSDPTVRVDAAIVSTPSSERLDTVRVLGEAGVDQLVEKPLASSMQEGRAIVAEAARTGTVVGVDQNFRDHYAFGLAREVVRSGEIGAVVAIDHRELLFREVRGWRAEARQHALSVMGVHWFDGFRHLLPDDADWLVCRTARSPALAAAGDTDAAVQIRFGPATVQYTQSFASRIERVETIVLGEHGTLRLDYGSLTVATRDGERTVRNPYADEHKPESAYRRLEEVLDAAAGGVQPPNSAADNLKTLSLLMGAYRSAESGEPVRFEQGVLP